MCEEEATSIQVHHEIPYRKPVTLVIYILLLLYAFILAPGSISTDMQFSRVVNVIALNLSAENSIFLAMFLLIGVYGLSLIALLFPGAQRQKYLSTPTFCIAGFLLGFYAIGQYIALRRRVTRISRAEYFRLGPFLRAPESTVFASTVFVASVGTCAVALGVFRSVMGSFVKELVQFGKLLAVYRFVAVVFADVIVSTVVLVDPLTEDMQRRGWSFTGKTFVTSFATALTALAVPGIGLGTYLLARPPLSASLSELESDPAREPLLSNRE